MAGRAGGGAGSEAEYGAVCLTRDTCVAIGSDLVTHQNRCADVQGFEWAQLGHDTLGGRLLAYLRDQGATVPDWAVCRVPAGRTAVLAQLRDEFTGWWRLYSAQPADTPLPSDVTEQLDDAAQQVQTAYMDYVLLDARTLRSAKRGPADPGGASGPSRRQRQHRSRSTSSLMSLGSAPLHPGGASSVNVNGLGSPLKARALVSHLQQVGADVAMVQETHATDTTALESCLRAAQGACLPWRHCLAASPAASPRSCGTAILARSRLSLPGCVLQPPSTDAAGRVVCWDWDVGHLRLRFVCVYAPTAVADKPAFFAGLHPHLATDRVLVVGGDWNCVTDASQEAAPSPSRAAGAPQLASLLAQFSLVDPWASKRGGAKGYTHPATPKPATPARLDRWYVSATAAPWVVDVARTYGAPGDHNGVLLTLSLPDLPHAHREQWRFPTYLLFHPSLRLELKQRLEAHVAANPVASTGDGACTQWEADKFFLREAATSIHRRHARQTRDGLHGVVLAADAAAALADRPGASAAQRQAAAMANLAVREERAAAAAASHNARAALMEEHGERGTRWFHRQADEPAAGAQEPITHLKVPGQPAPVALTGPGTRNTVSAAAAAMYSSTSPTGLFRVQPVCTVSQQQLLEAIDRKVPADLQAAAEGSGDGALSDAELMAALAGSANGKAPGSDGVPYEVYKVFWALLGPRLCAAAAAAFAAAADAHDGGEMAAALPASWREGIITLIYKGKSLDRAELASYRPITLLNCDFKMVSKAVCARLQPALDAVVDELQTAFITGRWIGDNALYLQGLIEWMRLDVGADGTPRQGGALYFLDIEKAYDRVHRQWLYASAEGLGFGPRMLRWIRLLTANGSARVCVNGMLSDAFPVLNGLPQGSTASPPLAERQQQPSSQQRVAAGGLSGVQPAAGVGGPPAARPRPAGAGPAGVQQQPSGAPAPRPPLDQQAAAGQDQEQTAVMQRYLAYMADLHLQQQRRVQQQQQQEQQRQVQPPRPRTGSRFAVLATLGGQDGVGDGAATAASGRGRRAQPAVHAPPPPPQQQPRSKGRGGPAQLPQQRAGRLGGGLPPPQDGASSPPHVPTGRPAGGQQDGGGSGSGRHGGGAGQAVPQPPPQARPPLQTLQPAGGGKGRGRGLGAPAGASADMAGRAGGGAGSEAEYGAVCLNRDTCVAIGSDLVTHQNRCADVQGYEWTQLGHDTLGGRLLAYLRDQGATVPDWAVCRVPRRCDASQS
ncbi:hypothetical protein CHLRE_03g208554v5 [Chlamydomonas reinhardtii]|uniref:Reverse transcriptase domain-containing protein n=1 Tax=Chlamydomonas reinhardtii TaxID=3055 RepID=A0A2K3DYV2_CHLRE|nr:uncharacterized protein CHLRE_03g208554v5 [Chlamydomonas reinhardtii]PNW85713.1 hypothetical protein CHLRE_03g208554v5 [Chlamydomonas reinhardtii]